MIAVSYVLGLDIKTEDIDVPENTGAEEIVENYIEEDQLTFVKGMFCLRKDHNRILHRVDNMITRR